MDRPRRNAAIQALQKMKEIHEWEECTESSALFKIAQQHFEELFANEDNHAQDHEVFASDEEAVEEEFDDESEEGYESSFIDDDDELTADSDEWQPKKRVRFSADDESDLTREKEKVASDDDDEMESEDDSELDSDEYSDHSDHSSTLSDNILSKECEDFADNCFDNCFNTSDTNTTILTNDTNVANTETSSDHISLDTDDPPTLTRT